MGRTQAPNDFAATKLCENCGNEYSRTNFSKHRCDKPRKKCKTKSAINKTYWAKYRSDVVSKQRKKRPT
ncbi:hypothetical protein PF003_g24176 [Phytophthora fragariae]|nr:hypothetical protein PF003_g24176 [Phytophthora fragariae]